MFNIKNMIRNWITRRWTSEIIALIESLKSMNDCDVSLIVATVTNIRNSFFNRMNLDFGNPAALLIQRPRITIELGNLIRESAKNKSFIIRTAYIVWLHTLRVVQKPELIMLGRELWRELGRGIEYLNGDPELVKQCTTENSDLSGYQHIPPLS